MNLRTLDNAPRLLLEVPLRPAQGSRFQPTGFPDLGAATYQAEDIDMLLVESPQSMANRLEDVCWDEGDSDLVPELDGLPYVHVDLGEGAWTNSILEAHRLNSPYIFNTDNFEQIADEIGFDKKKPFDRRRLARVLLKYDVNSLIHGVFLEKVGGVLRLPRAVSGFIEASDVNVVASGGVKVDRVKPDTKGGGKTAKEGYGNVPYHRTEFTGDITAFFNVDLSQIRGYGFDEAVGDMLIGLALFKIRRFLQSGLRLRTACDLMIGGEVKVTAPQSWTLPTLDEISDALPPLIEASADHFASPAVTKLEYTG